MTWEHFEVMHSCSIGLFDQASHSFLQGDISLSMIYTGKSRVFKEYRDEVTVNDEVFSGGCGYGVMSALRNCAKKLESNNLLMSTAGCTDDFSESGLSSHSGYGYLKNNLIHVLCQGFTIVTDPLGHPLQPESNEILFFSCGLDVDTRMMTSTFHHARVLGKTALIGFDSFVNKAGRLSLTYKKNSFAYGLLWGISLEYKRSVALEDDMQNLYRTLCLTVQNKHSQAARSRRAQADYLFDELEVMVYVANNFEQGKMSVDQREKIIALAKEHSFDRAYIRTLENL